MKLQHIEEAAKLVKEKEKVEHALHTMRTDDVHTLQISRVKTQLLCEVEMPAPFVREMLDLRHQRIVERLKQIGVEEVE